ncbi:ultraviolet-B receptor UVR8 isoform X2 [Cicer arietinum]|uniref:Probable E3 ubiquitin-protein ligase HERC4 isoform X2 n=1 Tax=Cicer arietinum TaxID=3827 RepID=A0A1S2YYT6_CICAR|nr:probable E3 ubiquitin-protein ligase HERC4 isoform X2 [Cicer arietinum]
MWRSRGLLRKLKTESGAVRWMSTVMSFGDGSHGALGLATSTVGMGVDAYEPTPIPSLPSDILSVYAGHYHSLALNSQGQLWAWGRNNEAQLGRGLSSRETWNEPKRVEGLENVKVCGAYASGVVSSAVGEDGSVWVWGKSKRGQLGLGKHIIEAVAPSRVEALSGENVAKVSFGWGHALALTVDGKLFGWGYYADGRIGNMRNGHLKSSPLDSTLNAFSNNTQFESSDLEVAEKRVLQGMEKENNMPIIWEPRLVEELRGIHVVDIACGLDHSLVLCRDGSLLSCGSNVYGQLGRAREDLGFFPVDINFTPVSIAAGLGHSLVICQLDESDGSVIVGTTNIASWGWNISSQLGRSGPANFPALIDALAEENPVSVSAGRAHSVALTSKGEMWVWGSGKNGRLGLGSSVDEVEPFYLDSLEGFQILQAVSGFDHNLVLVAG